MKPEAVYFNAEIGSNYDSMTVYPNIPTEVGDDNVLIIDMPGTPKSTQVSTTPDPSIGY
jgi:hypothetical protein